MKLFFVLKIDYLVIWHVIFNNSAYFPMLNIGFLIRKIFLNVAKTERIWEVIFVIWEMGDMLWRQKYTLTLTAICLLFVVYYLRFIIYLGKDLLFVHVKRRPRRGVRFNDSVMLFYKRDRQSCLVTTIGHSVTVYVRELELRRIDWSSLLVTIMALSTLEAVGSSH